MKGAIKIGTVRGIGVFIHWSFFLLLGWIAYNEFDATSSWSSVGNELLMVLLVFTCVLLHEFGHAMMAQHYKVNTRDITLLPLGGVARLEHMPEKPIQELMVAIAGPLVNVLIILLLIPVILLGKGWPLALDLEFYETNGILVNLLLVNCSLLFFNLLPAFPMDGGRVLRSLLALKLSRVLATKIAVYTGMVLALAFVVIGLYFNLILSLIGIFVFFGAVNELKSIAKAKRGYQTPLQAILRKDIVQANTDFTLKEATDVLFSSNSGFLVLVNDDRTFSALTSEDLFKAILTTGEQTRIGDLPLVFSAGIPLVSAPESIFNRMLQSGNTALVVEEQQAVSGVITLREVELLIRLS